jgi:spermidine/putrescine-binding protein
MKHQSKMKLSLSICTSAMMIVITPLNLSSCSSTGIVLANFESYMAPKLMDQLHEKHSIRFVNYSTNEDILAKFANSYDIAVPSTYTVLELIKNDLIGGVNQEVQIDGTSHTIENVGIDWQYLGQKYQLTALPDRFGETALPLIDKATPKSESYDPKYDPSNAQSLFSETIDNVIDAVDAYAHEPAHRYYGNDKSILYYAIPYFLQD